MTCHMDEYLGAYVLDALEPDEARAVHAHLRDCHACRDEVGSLTGTASALALLTAGDLEQFYDPDGSPAEAAPARPRRRAAWALTAAVLVTVAGVGGVRGLSGAGSGASRPDVVRAVDAQTHVRAAVRMVAHNWGTQVHLDLADAAPRGWCALIAHARDGRVDTAATWSADRTGWASVDGATAIPVDRLSELDVVTRSGAVLVRITLPDHNG